MASFKKIGSDGNYETDITIGDKVIKLIHKDGVVETSDKAVMHALMSTKKYINVSDHGALVKELNTRISKQQIIINDLQKKVDEYENKLGLAKKKADKKEKTKKKGFFSKDK